MNGTRVKNVFFVVAVLFSEETCFYAKKLHSSIEAQDIVNIS